MIHQRTREALSVFTGVLVLIVSLVSGCFGCLPPAAGHAAKAPEHACCKQAPSQGCHIPPKKAPAGSDCSTGKLDLGSTEHFWSKVVTLDASDAVHSGSVLVVAIAPQDNIFAFAPPGRVSPPDLPTLHSSFRI